MNRLEQVVEGELENLKYLDRLAWIQIGDYMVQVRERINRHMKKPKSERSDLGDLCAQMEKLDDQFANSMEPRVLQFLIGMRKEIGRQIRNGRVRPGPIKRKSEFWPKPKKTEPDPAEEAKADMISNWMSDGFPID